eukprot:jgi/Psemu1/46026/gm1.46026_g
MAPYLSLTGCFTGRKFAIGSRSCLLGSRNIIIGPPSARSYSMTANYSPATMMTTTTAMATSSRSLPMMIPSLRKFVSSLWSIVAVPRPAILPRGVGLPPTTGVEVAVSSSACNSTSILSWAVWLIKRTYQPSLLKKKRQCGYMKRKQSVGGRRIFKRRRQKGRKRLFGA